MKVFAFIVSVFCALVIAVGVLAFFGGFVDHGNSEEFTLGSALIGGGLITLMLAQVIDVLTDIRDAVRQPKQ